MCGDGAGLLVVVGGRSVVWVCGGVQVCVCVVMVVVVQVCGVLAGIKVFDRCVVLQCCAL